MEKMPQKKKEITAYEEQALSPEALATRQLVSMGVEKKEGKEQALSETQEKITEIMDAINKSMKGDPFKTQDPDIASTFLHETYGKIAEGSRLLMKLKELGLSKEKVKALQDKFDSYRDLMAKGEDELEKRILKNAA